MGIPLIVEATLLGVRFNMRSLVHALFLLGVLFVGPCSADKRC